MSNAPDPLNIFFYILTVGLPATLILTLLGLVIGFILGFILALMRVYGAKEVGWFANGYEKLFRGVPLLIQISILIYGIPGLFGWLHPLSRPVAGVVLALGLRSGAYQSQIIRGAILSVNPGQMEAAQSLGMSRRAGILHVVFPQALKLAVPGFSNEYAVVIKDTSFAYLVGIIEMTKAAFDLTANHPELWSLSMAILAITYFLFTYPITKLIGDRQIKKLKNLGLGGD